MNKSLENCWVRDSYNAIASEFSQTRNYNWPEFEEFWKSLSGDNLKSWNLKKLKILDVWCWNGRLINFLSKKLWDNFDYVWLDISEWLLAEARKNHPNFKFICWDMIDLNEVKDNSIDYVFSIAAFHHLDSKKNRIKHLKELSRVLKPWWLIFMTNWNLFQKKYLKCFFINFFQKKAWNDTYVPFKSWSLLKSNRYYHAFLPSELRKLFRKSWLSTEKEFYMRRWKIINWLIWSFNICNIIE